MSRFPKPCLTCNQLTTGGSYCSTHERKKGAYYNSQYRKERQGLRQTATHCHICGLAFTDPKEITADHIYPGQTDSPLAPAHLSCNSRRGNKPL